MIGKQLSHFHIIEKIGEGGMGVVYRAEDRRLGRHVALKVMRPEFVANEERRQRFLREARTAASVTHPNIVTVHEIDEADGVTFIAMELLEGQGLGALLAGGPLPAEEALRIAADVAEGLARAHAAGVIHRDLKPDNVIIGPDGKVTLLDFGLAKLHEGGATGLAGTSDVQTVSMNATQDGRILGTAAYMSPEQARGLPVDARSDVFSFGVLLYEMVTGKTPFSGPTITDTLSAILRDRQPPVATLSPDVPAELERIIDRCLEKKPEDRYGDTQHLSGDLRALKRVTDSGSQPLPRVGVSGDAPRAARRFRPGPAALAAAAAVLTLAALAWGLPRLSGPAATRATSIAVLPFANLQDSADEGRFGQILQELIITDLSGLPATNVYSSQRLFDIQKQLGRSASRTIDRDMASQVAREAGAGTMLTGSVSQLGDRWILTSQLVDVARGTVVGSERIDGADLYVMVDDLTRRIREKLGRPEGAGGTDLAVRDRTSSSIEAYQAYLRGNELLEDLEFAEAVTAFREAVTIDPAFGQAYYKLAIASWWNRGIEGMGSGNDENAPARILATLLAGNLKLSEKDGMLARAVLPLVEQRYDDAQGLYRELVRLYPDEKEAWYGLGEALRHGRRGASDPETLTAFEKAIDLDPAFRLPYYHAVEIYEMRGLYDEGLRRLGRLLELYPDDPVWRTRYVGLLIGKDDPAATEAAIRDALDRAPDGRERQRLLATFAEAEFDRGRMADGEALIQRGLAIEDGGPPGRLLAMLAVVRRYQQRFPEAEKIYGDLLRLDPRNKDVVLGLADLYDEQRRYDEALPLIRRAIDADPQSVYYERWVRFAARRGDPAGVRRAIDAGLRHFAGDDRVAHVRKGLLATAEQSYRELGDFVQAEAFAREALDPEPRAEDHGRLGWALVRLDRYDEAREAFRSGLALDAESLSNLSGMARLALHDGDDDLAVAEGERSAGAAPGAGQLVLLEAYAFGGRLDLADALVAEGLPHTAKARTRLDMFQTVANTFLRAGLYDRALAQLDRAQALAPELTFPVAAGLRGLTLIKLGRSDEAAGVVSRALKDAPRDWLLNLVDAGLRLSAGDAAGAEAGARELLTSGPVHAEALTVLATALARQGRHAEALDVARRRVAMDPGRAGKTLLAWVLIDGGLDVDEGLRLAREARDVPPRLGEAELTLPYHASPEHCLGLAYLKKGDPARAVELLQQAAELRPDRPSIAEHLRQALAARA